MGDLDFRYGNAAREEGEKLSLHCAWKVLELIRFAVKLQMIVLIKLTLANILPLI